MRDEPGPLFQTPLGAYEGVRDGDVVRVLGVRYATAARFAAPVPVPPHEGVVRAVEPAPLCPQPLAPGGRLLGDPNRGVTYDEDCQRLSITVPADLAPGERLPVLVWIHGGSYVSGGGDLPIADPAALVAGERVVVVAVTYRLGVLGFLGDGASVPANLGLLDLLEALRFVRAAVAGFGGDPERVTLFGHSSGGDAIAHLMIADGAEGLFRRAVLQSAPFGIRRRRSRMTALMLAAVGRLEPEAAEDVLFAAQGRAQRAARRFGYRAGMPFGVQYGHAPLPPEDRADEAWRRVAPRFDVLVGWSAEETALFAALVPAMVRLFALPVLGRPVRSALLRATTDAVYRRGGRAFATLLARAGARVTTYELAWRPPGGLGAAHSSELPLLFPSVSGWAGALLIGDVDPAALDPLGRGMRRAWAAFARDGVVPAVRSAVPLRIRRPGPRLSAMGR
ncbi:carboxylesterase family protein [Amnibacterium sp. CER49]|uniref:carboxylesterase family protein n=1 Tax=Amnibacterium sp. CER49 TaxID=3039161 RepID=UPI0024471011|nr:carboxylesterase family protein [Amnibacterium sp. CER49]MDH2443137.1 carboxylesterase family protein [Amnibacterium sp. CER49]